MQQVQMPPLGQTTDELRITAWLKGEGESVALGEPLFEVDTDKATLQVESFVSGTLLKILHGAGETVRVGTLVAYVGEADESIPSGEQVAPIEQPAQTRTAPETRTESRNLLASPAARQLARQHGIELDRVKGSGPEGRIEKRDVQALIEERLGSST